MNSLKNDRLTDSDWNSLIKFERICRQRNLIKKVLRKTWCFVLWSHRHWKLQLVLIWFWFWTKNYNVKTSHYRWYLYDIVVDDIIIDEGISILSRKTIFSMLMDLTKNNSWSDEGNMPSKEYVLSFLWMKKVKIEVRIDKVEKD